MMEFISQPWPWYVAGPLIGLIVPILLILGNKPFGISSTLRQICAACVPSKIEFFNYDWKKDSWNLYFIAGVTLGAFIATFIIGDPSQIRISTQTISDLSKLGITDFTSILPIEIFSWQGLLTLRGFILIVIGGFLVGFGTRYGNGCTSGHAITGISNLQWSSMVATACFFAGGMFATYILLPLIM
ncbi:MAG: YeeE/YedE family protein [Cytophagales bacterium]